MLLVARALGKVRSATFRNWVEVLLKLASNIFGGLTWLCNYDFLWGSSFISFFLIYTGELAIRDASGYVT